VAVPQPTGHVSYSEVVDDNKLTAPLGRRCAVHMPSYILLATGSNQGVEYFAGNP